MIINKLTALAALGTVIGGPAFAQAQVTAAEPDQTQDIIVTAQKRAENVQRVPIAIAVLPAAAIAERGVQSVADVANALPGVKFSEFSASGNVSVRGIGTTIVSGAGEGSVAVHLDGIFLSQPQALTMVQGDLGRIEVLRGPQSTLYGRNSTGGVLNFISAAPTTEPEAQVALLSGNYERRQVAAHVSGAVSDAVRVRLSGSYQNRDGWTLNTLTGQRLEDLESYGGRLSIDADAAPGWNMQFRAAAQKENFAGPAYDSFFAAFPVVPAPFSDYDARRVVSTVTYDSAKRLALGSLRNSFDIGDTTLVSLTGYVDFRQRGQFDGIGSALSVPLNRTQKNKDFSQEFNLSGTSASLDWLVGLYYLNSTGALNSATILAGLGAPDVFVTQRSSRNSISGFADGTFHVSDRFRLYGGARLLHESLDQRLTNRLSVGLVLCSADDEQRYRETAVTGRAGAQYDVGDRVMAYGQYSRGFKTGGFSQSFCDNPFGAERVDAVEGGIKASLPEGRGTINASLFYYAYRDLQLEQASPAGIPVVNAPRSHVFGIEVDASIRLVQRLRLDASGSYLNARYDRFANSDPLLGVAPGASLRGVALNNAPRFSTTLGLENDFRIGGTDGVRVRGEMIYSGKYNVREFDLPYTIQPEYVMFNAFATIHLDDDRYSLRAFGKNLSNETILAGVLGFGGALGSFQAPRTYGLEAIARF